MLNGGGGRDRMSGGAHDDRMSGGSGNDTMAGNGGRNRLSGGAGNDRIDSVTGTRETVNCGRGRRDVRPHRPARQDAGLQTGDPQAVAALR